jgi:hypothetical protein
MNQTLISLNKPNINQSELNHEPNIMQFEPGCMNLSIRLTRLNQLDELHNKPATNQSGFL